MYLFSSSATMTYSFTKAVETVKLRIIFRTDGHRTDIFPALRGDGGMAARRDTGLDWGGAGRYAPPEWCLGGGLSGYSQKK